MCKDVKITTEQLIKAMDAEYQKLLQHALVTQTSEHRKTAEFPMPAPVLPTQKTRVQVNVL